MFSLQAFSAAQVALCKFSAQGFRRRLLGASFSARASLRKFVLANFLSSQSLCKGFSTHVSLRKFSLRKFSLRKLLAQFISANSSLHNLQHWHNTNACNILVANGSVQVSLLKLSAQASLCKLNFLGKGFSALVSLQVSLRGFSLCKLSLRNFWAHLSAQAFSAQHARSARTFLCACIPGVSAQVRASSSRKLVCASYRCKLFCASSPCAFIHTSYLLEFLINYRQIPKLDLR